MGIDSESDTAANLQIGPTSLGMVRLYVEAEGIELPLDFDPDEAEEIAEEIRAAAAQARRVAEAATGRKAPGRPGDGKPAARDGGKDGGKAGGKDGSGGGLRRPRRD